MSNTNSGLPAEVKKFDKKSARVFSSLLEEESYRHFESRVMLAGEQGTGKTTIARHLVGKQPTQFRMSTDGIELYNGLSFMDIETNCWLGGQQDFTMEELTITRSLLQDETLKKGKFGVHDKKRISQNTLGKEDKPLSASETPAKTHETHDSHSSDLTAKLSDFGGQLSNTTSRTESLNDSFRPNHHLLNKHGNPADELIKLSDDQSEHKEAQENRDSNCRAGMHDSSHARPVSPSRRSVENSNLSDYLISVDEPNKYDLPATQEPIDTFDEKYTHEVLYDEDTSTSVPGYLHSDSGFTGDVHIETVTKPVIIRKLKNFFGISKKVKEVKVSITTEKFFEKSVKVGKKLLHNKKIAPIIIWDFGGQDVFYSTHQTFLTYRAIYILVLDGSRKLDDPCPTDQYLPGKSGQKTAKEPKRYDLDRNRIPADFYYVASMVRAHDDSGYLQSAGFTTRSIAIAFQSSSLMIPPALSFRFISYCLYVWAVKTYGDSNKDMLFHRSGVFTIDSSLDMYMLAKMRGSLREDEKCKPGCTVTKDEFLKASPSDIHLRRLSLLYSPFEAKELAIHLGFSNREVNVILETEDPLTSSFAILLRCRDSRMVTFNDIKEAIESIGKRKYSYTLQDMEPEKWDLVPTAEHIDRLAPLVGKYSLPFLIELGMDFNTWEQISHRQNERDLVRLNQDILEEWRFRFCRRHNLKPTLREIARAFSNIGKNVKIVDNTLSDLF
ncbi:Hypothetical predicted protein [Mytilus galloprovincialis]|uniref:Death domain-containing protein n=1 Tax=Mytilus galloprovincialis TaxID=29158 RepID=A0A8B6EYW5_MYTGA|nr:Hypothetical predicted protein [Mytilus galloprovincialis]